MQQILCDKCGDTVTAGEARGHVTDRHPDFADRTSTLLEVLLTWKCPACGANQKDSVNPEAGPYISCTCGKCGKSFSDEELNPEDAEAWEDARAVAESFLEEVRADV